MKMENQNKKIIDKFKILRFAQDDGLHKDEAVILEGSDESFFHPFYLILSKNDLSLQKIITMHEYIFYTFEGYTESRTGEEVENCQVLGYAMGADVRSAKAELLRSNPWIEEKGFDICEIVAREVVGERLYL